MLGFLLFLTTYKHVPLLMLSAKCSAMYEGMGRLEELESGVKQLEEAIQRLKKTMGK